MMKVKNWIYGLGVACLIVIAACSPDDDGGSKVKLRDYAEVYEENRVEIEEYLKTHYFKVRTDINNPSLKEIVFDTIAGANADKVSIFDSPELKSKTITTNDVNYTLYYLQVRKGAETAYQPTFADNAIAGYAGYRLNGDNFDGSVNPVEFTLPTSLNGSVIRGFMLGLIEFRGASDFTENSDGTITYADDYGIGAVFIPSGLGYYATPPSASIRAYEPIMFTFQLYAGKQMDHDNDGIPSYLEDKNNNMFFDDDSDGDRIPDFNDPDDDNDGVPTADEIEVNDLNEDGIITADEIDFIDTDNDGTPDYLDPKVF
ncbi:FKBP-type peptidyl-prolyl cis-trans isomerase [Mesonia sediminis]|uniref:peptidylprolyl isomerase n=1 Tax=Mesonia sediminis TaxID=1703946 RepID=A0ABW5SFQ9_9FLAO